MGVTSDMRGVCDGNVFRNHQVDLLINSVIEEVLVHCDAILWINDFHSWATVHAVYRANSYYEMTTRIFRAVLDVD
ncbi:MAG: hypothetical protein M0Q13_08155 [Methanothrix sp.]|nr:hypothetical protein [Methanothrix sp.]